MSKTTSNGGSTDYYKIKLPKSILKDNGDGTVTIETGDIIRYALANDFNLGNIFKALVRWGKKEGIDYQYDRNKIVYFADDHIRANTVKVEKVTAGQPKVIIWFKNEGKLPNWIDPSDYIQIRRRNGTESSIPVAARWYRWSLSDYSELEKYDGDIMEWRYAEGT